MNVTYCRVCGGSHFQFQPVLWPQLIADWQLTASEAEYIDRQQGKFCINCGANLRSIALAAALDSYFSANFSKSVVQSPTPSLLVDWIQHPAVHEFSVLEINEAGSLSPYLKQLPRHILGSYPELDMCAMALPSMAFDIVIHSDTIEHVKNPVKALEECYRVLKPGGALCMTVPIVVGRMSRNRAGLIHSHHSYQQAQDYIVHTEFGADFWTYLMKSGFTEISTYAIEYPSAMSFCARKV